MSGSRRYAIVFDGSRWHVRRLASIGHDMERDEKVYRCDAPISSDHLTVDGAARAAENWRTGQFAPDPPQDGESE